MATVTLSLFSATVLLALLCRALWREGASRGRRVCAVAALILGGIALGCGTYSLWYHHRPRPRDMSRELFQGVRYHREALLQPRPIVVHWMEIDLDAPGAGVVVTPPSPRAGRQLQATTVSRFLERQGAQVAINGHFFNPWFSHGPLWYYPHEGDPVSPLGLAASSGEVYNPPRRWTLAFYTTFDGQVRIERVRPSRRPLGIDMALAGTHLLLEDGQLARQLSLCGSSCYSVQPRTAIALDQSGRGVILMVIDGRQPGYSEGVQLFEFAELIRQRGGYRALNLDWGGSTTMAIEGREGRGLVLNSPIHGRVPPGRERPVATHIGFFANPLEVVPET